MNRGCKVVREPTFRAGGEQYSCILSAEVITRCERIPDAGCQLKETLLCTEATLSLSAIRDRPQIGKDLRRHILDECHGISLEADPSKELCQCLVHAYKTDSLEMGS